MPPAHSHPHSPSPTPYANPTTTTAAAAAPPEVRRNLFSTHLSRRPASFSHTSIPTQEPTNYIAPFQPPPRSPSRSPIHQPPITTTAIIETHPNGRPLLPTLPHLPAHLRLSTTSSDEDEQFHPEDDASLNNSPTRYNHHHHTPMPTGESDAGDRERIERTLVEMMSRQRQRVGGGSGGSPRALRSGGVGNGEGEGRTREEEELFGLIMGSLREKVAVLEGEEWMFGERGEGGEGLV